MVQTENNEVPVAVEIEAIDPLFHIRAVASIHQAYFVVH